MALKVNNNVASLLVQQKLGASQQRLQGNLVKLAAGLRISRAADDAAGLGISESLRAEMRGLQQAGRNLADGMSMVQTAEGALGSTGEALSRMRQLAVQSANGTLSDSDRANIQAEFSALQSEVDRIANATEFNGLQLSDGSTASVEVQAGAGSSPAGDRIAVILQDARSTTLGVDAASVDVTTQANAQAAISAIDAAITQVSGARASYGSAQRTLTAGAQNLQTYTENLVAAESRIRDVDFALETADRIRNDILGKAGVALLAQANLSSGTALGLLK